MRLSKARRACVEAMMKDTIFDAAGSVLAERGVDGLTMDRVATKVGVATASLYNYFRDKNELLQYCYSRMVGPFLQTMEETAREDMPAPQKLSRILQTALESSDMHKGLLKLLAGMGYEPEMKRTCRPRFTKILATVFEQGVQEGSFRPLNIADLTCMFGGCMSELFDLQKSGAPQSDVERFADTWMDATLNGIYAARRPIPEEASTHSTN